MSKAKTAPTRRKLPVKVLREFFKYDSQTGDLFYQSHRARHWFKSDRLWKSWNAQFGGKLASRIGHLVGYRTVTVNQRSYLAHRVIWALVTGAWPQEEIDHVNGDRADNRWCNLRAATRSQNARNTTMPRNNTSGATGVHWWKTGQLWQVYGKRKGQPRIVKYAKTFGEAVVLREDIKHRLEMTQRHGEKRVG